MEGLQPILEGVEQVLIQSDGEDEGFLNLDDDNNEAFTNDQTNGGKTTRKPTSEAWEFFDKIVENSVAKAKCKHCNAALTAAVGSGTSHLLKHARKVCPGRHLRLAPGQTQLNVKAEKDGSTILELKTKDKEFSQEFSRQELVNIVVMHEYPLSIVDHIGFRRFVSSLNSSFKIISRSTLKRDVMKMFNQDKRSLKALLEHNDSKIAITTDMWTASNQKKGYMVITSHFIHQQWVLRNRTLRFCYVPCPHTKGVIAKVLMECLSQYSLENKIARDILAIPVSTVASESAFSMGGRIVSDHRSRLHSDTVEALMCLQNWIMQDLKGKAEDSYSCSTITDDSDVEVQAQVVDFIDMDLDEDVDDD